MIMNSVYRQVDRESPGAIHDVGNCIKSWGKRGIISGGLFGFLLAAVLVAIPLTSDVLTFGTIGTLLVGAVECAVIAGGFGVLAAALYGQGILRSGTAGLERSLAAGRTAPEADQHEGDIPLAEWPARWAFPGSAALQPLLAATPNFMDTMDVSLPDIETQPNAIDSWKAADCDLHNGI